MTHATPTQPAPMGSPVMLIYSGSDLVQMYKTGALKSMQPYWDKFADKDKYPDGVITTFDGQIYGVKPYVNLIAMGTTKTSSMAAAAAGQIAAGTTRLTLARLRGFVVSAGLALVIFLQMMPQTAAVLPGHPTRYPLSVLIASQLGQYGNNWPALMSIAVAAGTPILVIFVVSYRRRREGLALGSAC